MKNKVLLLMVLFLVGCNVGESSSQESSLGQTSKETNYYKPTIKEEYKEISKDEFVNKVNSNYKSEFGYKYISLKVDWDNPEAEYYYYHFRGEVKDDLSLDNKDLFIQNLTGINISKPINAADFYATLYVNPLIKIDEGIKAAISYISRANKYIEETQPWVLAKDETKKEELGSIMNHLVACLRQTAIMLSPVLLKAPSVLFEALDIPSELQTYDSLRNFGVINGGKVSKITPLFPRIDAAVDTEIIANLMK